MIKLAANNFILLMTIVENSYLFLQKKGVNNISTVNNSKRPISIKKEAHHFPSGGRAA